MLVPVTATQQFEAGIEMAKKKTVKVSKSAGKKSATKKKATATKKAATKKAAKKKSTRKKVVKKPAQQNVSGKCKVLPQKFLAGMSVCLGGRFDYYPSKSDLQKFLRQEGANVTTKVTDQLDVLIVGKGKKSAVQKQAEKLNSSGAGIRIVDTLTDLVHIQSFDMPALLCSVPDLNRFRNLANLGWLMLDVPELNGESFDNVTIGDPKKSLAIDRFKYVSCSFTNTTLRNVQMGGYFTSVRDCVFEDVTLENFDIDQTFGNSYSGVSGSNVDFGSQRSGKFQDMQVDQIWIANLTDVEVVNCQWRQFRSNYHYRKQVAMFQKCELSKVGITKIDVHGILVDQCKLRDVTFDAGKMRELHFEKCSLSGVTISGLELAEVCFRDCDVKNVTVKECTGKFLSFGNSRLQKIDATGSTFSTTDVSDAQQKSVAGLNVVTRQPDATKLKELQRLADTFKKSDKLNIDVNGTLSNGKAVHLSVHNDWGIQLSYDSKSDKQHANDFCLSDYARNLSKADIAQCLVRLVSESGVSDLDVGSLKIKTSKCPLKPKELKQLIVNAFYEVMGKEPQSEEEIAQAQKEAKATNTKLRKEILSELEAAEVKKFNRRSKAERKQVHSFRKAKLKGLNLAGVNLSALDLAESDFSGADLQNANLQSTTLRKVDLSGANLQGAKLGNANLRGADLSKADLTGATLRGATLDDAKLQGAILDELKITGFQDLCGIDLSKAKISNTRFDKCCYNEKTRFPKSVKTADLKKMRWHGGGIPPHERKQNKKVDGPIDFDQFMARLNEITDQSRLKKATKMLKADSFQLFSEVTDSSVTGVVKSQSDSSLVYSCALHAEGNFTCCTQNLNHCGGLRGALCKHILVLVVGLTKGGQLEATSVDEWVNNSKMKQPELDKDVMSEILLKYKGAEAGEIDWRPTETVPEDFFAF